MVPAANRAARHAGTLVYGPLVPATARARPVRAKPVRARPIARRVTHRARPPERAHRAHRTARPVPRARPVRGYARGRASAVVAFAYAHLGAPYVFGAAGRRGFDCSGLTQAAYARAGVRLVHKAALQTGRAVSRAAARPGDLVKWGSYHVGVYVGGGWVIHAPKPGDRVKKSRLWGRYRFVRLL